MRKTSKTQTLFWFMTLSIIMIGCQKNEFVNLTSTISSDNSLLGTEEGKFLTMNINLTEELSEDLPLTVEIDRDLETGHYINLDDFHDYYEYSTDFGANWKRVRPNRLIIPKRSKNIKIRVSTIDDNKLEIDEEFTMKITPKTDGVFKISGEITPTKMIVFDNEVGKTSMGLTYELDDKNNYNLVGLNKEIKLNKRLKQYIDNGPEEKLIKDIKTLSNVGGIPINSLVLVYSREVPWGGYVVNFATDGTDRWQMGLNLILGYENFSSETEESIKTDFTTEGILGFVMVHEFGHILTLNNKVEIDITAMGPENCTNLYLREGCFHNESILNQFNNQFYLNENKFNEPNFVSAYAESNIAEDIAETFAFYVGQKNINKVVEESSGALRKINSLVDNDKLKSLKTQLINQLSSSQNFLENTGITEPIREFNRTYEGKHISCTDYESIKKEYEKNIDFKD